MVIVVDKKESNVYLYCGICNVRNTSDIGAIV